MKNYTPGNLEHPPSDQNTPVGGKYPLIIENPITPAFFDNFCQSIKLANSSFKRAAEAAKKAKHQILYTSSLKGQRGVGLSGEPIDIAEKSNEELKGSLRISKKIGDSMKSKLFLSCQIDIERSLKSRLVASSQADGKKLDAWCAGKLSRSTIDAIVADLEKAANNNIVLPDWMNQSLSSGTAKALYTKGFINIDQIRREYKSRGYSAFCDTGISEEAFNKEVKCLL